MRQEIIRSIHELIWSFILSMCLTLSENSTFESSAPAGNEDLFL